MNNLSGINKTVSLPDLKATACALLENGKGAFVDALQTCLLIVLLAPPEYFLSITFT
jgi:hypothetical protein